MQLPAAAFWLLPAFIISTSTSQQGGGENMASAWELKGRLEKAVHGEVGGGGHRRKVTCLKFNRSGSLLATGAADGSLRIYATVSTPQGLTALSSSTASTLDLRGHEKGLSSLGWNPASDTQLATCGYDRTVRLWDARHKGHETHKVTTAGSHAVNVNLAWSPNGQNLAVSNVHDQISFFDVRRFSSAEGCKRMSYKYEVHDFSWSPAGNHWVVCGAMRNGTGWLEVYTYPRQDSVFTTEAHTSTCLALSLDPTHQHLALGSADGLVSIWGLEELLPLRTMDRFNTAVSSLDFSYDGRWLAVGSEDSSSIDVTEVASGKQLALLKTEGGVNALAWHPKACLLAWSHEMGGGGGGGTGVGSLGGSSGSGGGRKEEGVRFVSVSDRV
ncbi:hypothetical protein VYU27_009493 [Nannochloropsis oceanica]